MSFWNIQVREAMKCGILRTKARLQHDTEFRVYHIEEILPRVYEGRIRLGYEWVRVGRFELYRLKGTKCVACGLEAKFFRKEYSNGCPILNLYGIGNNEEFVLFTKDHVFPRSKGGKKTLENLQPMCQPCNNKKADKITIDNPQIICYTKI